MSKAESSQKSSTNKPLEEDEKQCYAAVVRNCSTFCSTANAIPPLTCSVSCLALTVPCAWDWVHELLPVLEQALGDKQALPKHKLRSMEEFLERFPEVKEVILDDTERPVQRLKDNERQKQYYSGKKRWHTRKHITGSTRKKRVILLTQAGGGRVHDKRQLEEAGLVEYIPDEVAIEGNLGFQALQNEFENVHLPHKKPKGKALSEQQNKKIENLAVNESSV